MPSIEEIKAALASCGLWINHFTIVSHFLYVYSDSTVIFACSDVIEERCWGKVWDWFQSSGIKNQMLDDCEEAVFDQE